MHLTTNRSRGALATMFAAGLVAAGIIAAPAAHAAPINDSAIPDNALRECIKGALGVDHGDPIPRSDAEALTSLTCPENADIGSLAGLDELIGLKELKVSRNSITDLTPLTGLTGLQELEVSHNSITDLTPLTGLTGLQELHLAFNSITDLTPLENLTSLTRLRIQGNQISDLAPLAGLMNLEYLAVHFLPLADFDFHLLSGLDSLRTLALQNNGITDIGFVSQFDNLIWFTNGYNHITDISPIGSLPADQLQGFYTNNQTVDLGEVFVGVPIPNPVIGLDGSPVNLDALYDDATNTFTPVTPGPGTVTWTVDNVFDPAQIGGGYPNNFAGEISFTAVDGVMTVSANFHDVEVDGTVTLSAALESENSEEPITLDITEETVFTADDTSVEIDGATATFSAPGQYSITGIFGDFTDSVTVTVTEEVEPGDDDESEPGNGNDDNETGTEEDETDPGNGDDETGTEEDETDPGNGDDETGTEDNEDAGEQETEVALTAAIGDITRDACLVTIPVTTTGIGAFTLEVWDDQQIVEAFDWESTTSPETTEITWTITRPALEGAPGVGFVVNARGETLDHFDPYLYPAEVANQCAEEAGTIDPGEEEPTPTDPGTPPAPTLPETGLTANALPLLAGALLLIIAGSVATLVRRRA